MNSWYDACERAAAEIYDSIPETYRSRTFPGIIGDIKALPPKKALSLISRKKGLGKQYAYLYLTQGIDGGKGYQACACEALSAVLGVKMKDVFGGKTLDAGCAVGLTAGILGLENVAGFDLFFDLIDTARMVDSFTGKKHFYAVSDMTGTWTFRQSFDTVMCGLVCHHLKKQRDITTFFTNANRVMNRSGSLVITLPSGSLATPSQLKTVIEALDNFGFSVNRGLSGIVLSDDNPHSLFWMFLIVAEKTSNTIGEVFIEPGFGFQSFRTPVTREEKSVIAKETVKKQRRVRHSRFRFIAADDLASLAADKTLVYSTVSAL